MNRAARLIQTRALTVSAAGLAVRGGASHGGNGANGFNPTVFGAIAAAGAVAAATLYGSDHAPFTAYPRSHAFIAMDSDLKALETRVAELELKAGITGSKTNAAFVFVKPHAVTPKTISLVKDKLKAAGITVTGEGDFDAATIDKDMLIDTHYGAIASRAVKQAPKDLVVQPKAKAEFKKTFGMDWETALKKGLVYNAKQACEKLGVDGAGLDAKWGKLSKKKGPGCNLVKFGGGFYCGQVDGIFVINGFYMEMRAAYTTPPAQLHWFTVQWPAANLAWEDFRGKVLGATDPAAAASGSARRAILDDWQNLGLASEPNTGDNGVHASASPAEALFERMNWLGANVGDDIYGAAMLEAGVPLATIKAWSADPSVEFEGRPQSLFDLLEDLDAKAGLEKAQKILA